MASAVLSTGNLVVVAPVLSPEPPTPDSPQVSLVHSVLSLPEPRVSGCKQNYMCFWPFKRLSECPAVSLWQTETLLLFTAGCYLSSFQLWCCREARLGCRPHISQGNPQLLKYPSGSSAAAPGSPASSPLTPSPHCRPVSSCGGEVLSSVCLWLQGCSPASVQLVILDDFSTI